MINFILMLIVLSPIIITCTLISVIFTVCIASTIAAIIVKGVKKLIEHINDKTNNKSR